MNEENVFVGCEFFKLFSNKTRVQILFMLNDGEKNVNKISEHLEMTKYCVSQQLKILRELNLVGCSKKGRKIFYSIKCQKTFMLLNTLINMIGEDLSEELISNLVSIEKT